MCRVHQYVISEYKDDKGLTFKTEIRLGESINIGKGRHSQPIVLVMGDSRNVEDEWDVCCHIKIRIFSPFAVFS